MEDEIKSVWFGTVVRFFCSPGDFCALCIFSFIFLLYCIKVDLGKYRVPPDCSVPTCKVDGDIFSPQILNWWSLLKKYCCQSVETYWNIRVTNISKCGPQYYSRLSDFFEWAIQADWCVWEWNVHNWSCGVRKIKELCLLPIPYSIVCIMYFGVFFIVSVLAVAWHNLAGIRNHYLRSQCSG